MALELPKEYLDIMAQSYDDGDMNDYASERCYVFPSLFSPDECDAAVELIQQRESHTGLVGENYGATPAIDYGLRKCNVTIVPRNEDTKWLHDRCELGLKQANDDVWRFNVVDYSQPMRMLTYRDTDHFGSWHQDHGPGQTSFRKLTMIVQLDRPEIDYTGGEFFIMGGDIPEEYYQKGAAIVFPTYLYHRVAEITGGLRRSLVHRAIGPRFQ